MNAFAAISKTFVRHPLPSGLALVPQMVAFPSLPSARLESAPPVTTPASGANSLRQPSGAKAARNFAIPAERLRSIFKEPKTPRLDALLVQYGKEAREREALTAEFHTLSRALQAKAEREEWSQRDFTKHVGISRQIWARLLTGKAPMAEWMTLVRAAATR